MSWRTNRKTKKPFQSGLHPFVARPSAFEPILTTSQKLTPAQKQHLDEFQNREDLLQHMASFHGLTFEQGVETGLDPQVKERFGIPDRPYTSDQTLRLRHLQEHIENIEERVRTAPGTKPLTPEEYRKAGVDEAVGGMPENLYQKIIKRRPRGEHWSDEE